MNPFVERHQGDISGVLSCFDRVVISGTLPAIAHAGAMTGLLGYLGIRVFDYTQWAEPLREALRANAERLAREAGLTIEFIRRHKAFRKEDRIQAILATRGAHPGLVHVFAAMESCTAYRPWFDKAKGQALLKPASGKCLHYDFYFIDADFGLGYVRVPTWAPFRLQVYFNGHAWLAQQLRAAGIDFAMADNAFLSLADPLRAQQLADTLDAHTLHQHLDRWAARFCPVVEHFRGGYHWSFMQVEYATDVVFRQQAVFQPLYQAIVRTAVHVIRAEHVAMFLGHKLSGHFQDELGNDFSTRIQGTRIRHHMGPASIKLYDKAGLIARVECTANDVSFSSSTTVTWNSVPASASSSSPPCARASTVSRICAPSCRPPTPVTWPSWPASITPMLRKRRSPRWPARPRPRAAPSAASTSSSIPTSGSSSPSRAARGPSPGFAPAICVLTSGTSHPGAPPTS
jgi:hypothetical protein